MVVQNQKPRLRIGVLRGGPSDEYEVSLKTGQNIIQTLRERPNYDVQDVFIDRSGVWHLDGVSRPLDRLFPHIDVAVVALHGRYGEDGRVQQILESHRVPFTGSGSFASALGMNKVLSKKFFRQHNLLVPEHFLIKKNEYNASLLHDILFRYPHLRVVKPVSAGSSLGVRVANSDAEFDEAIRSAFEFSDSVMLEEWIKGREATCGVTETEDGEVFALHPIEIRDKSKTDQSVWTYESKYSNDLHELICPGDFSTEQSHFIQQSAVDAHKALGLKHYSRSDFIVNRNGVYILETNSLPGLTNASLFPHALSVAGISLGEFLEHLISLALRDRR